MRRLTTRRWPSRRLLGPIADATSVSGAFLAAAALAGVVLLAPLGVQLEPGNSPDHHPLGRSVLGCVGDAGNRGTLPELADEGQKRWGSPHWRADKAAGPH